MLSAERRASNHCGWYRPASSVVAIATAAPGPAHRSARSVSAVTCATLSSSYWPEKTNVSVVVLTVCVGSVHALAPQLTTTSPGSTLLSASIAACTTAAVALYAIGAVVWPANVSVNVPPVALLTRTVWVSSVFMSLNGPQPPELPLPAGVSSPVTSHRLLSSSKSMSPATWQHAPRSTCTFMIFCSDARSSDGVAPSTNLKRESWK